MSEQQPRNAPLMFSDLRTKDDWDAFTPSTSLDWQVAEEAMI